MSSATAKPVIEASHLDKSFHSPRSGSRAVLRDISLMLRKGEFVSLLGPSGCGKSTLLNMLAGLEKPEAGSIAVNGVTGPARPPIAYMQQKDLLLPWRTLWRNILLGAELKSRAELALCKKTARVLLMNFQLEDFTGYYPAQLSGGMRQRAALIRTLLCGKEIMLLDEPFGALDALTRAKLQSHLLRVWREMGKSVLLVTHDVEEAILLSTRIILMAGRPGRLVADLPVTIPYQERHNSNDTLRMKSQLLQILKMNEQEDERN